MCTSSGTTVRLSSGSIQSVCKRVPGSRLRSLERSGHWCNSTQRNYERHGMTSSPLELRQVVARNIRVADEALVVDLADGRTLSVPLVWYPRLAHGTPTERANWRLIGRGEGIHWPQLDEDISVEGLLAGRRSGESQASLQRWLQARNAAG